MSSSEQLSVLTPYLFPADTVKVPNLGDGFILRAIERWLGSFPDSARFTSRRAPSDAQKQLLLQSRAIVLAGANQLDDNFAPWPGIETDEMRAQPYVFAPMGIGIHGDPARNVQMSPKTTDMLGIIHERIRFSSWRCPRTVAYLRRSIPRLAPHFLMTGCPTIYDRPLLESTRFLDGQDIVAVTVTERGDFWDREVRTIDFVARRFPAAQKWLVVHQDYAIKRKRFGGKLFRAFGRTSDALLAHAVRRGYEIRKPHGTDEGLALYKTVDQHFGSRLHAHLVMLSLNKRSFLTKVDERATGIAEHFGFPLCDPARFDDVMDFDFEDVRQAALRTFPVLQEFITELPRA